MEEGLGLMGKKINTFDVVDCNKALEAAGFSARLHMHDACGGQYFSWQEDQPGVKELLAEFFSARGDAIEFVDGDDAFVVR